MSKREREREERQKDKNERGKGKKEEKEELKSKKVPFQHTLTRESISTTFTKNKQSWLRYIHVDIVPVLTEATFETERMT